MPPRWCSPANVAVYGTIICGLLACASVPGNAGFGDVQAMVAGRDRSLAGGLVWDATADTTGVLAAQRAKATDSVLSRQLTPRSAVALALVQNPGIQVTYSRLGVARADVVAAHTGPQLFLDLAALRDGAGSAIGSVLELNLSTALLGIFQIPRQRRAADASFASTKLEVAQAVLDLAARTRATYYAVAAATQLVEIDSTISYASSLGAEFARKQRDAGNITELDLAAQEALAAQSRIDLNRSRQELADAREDLALVIGVSSDEGTAQARWRTLSRLPDPPASEIYPMDAERSAVEHRLDLEAARGDITARGAALGLTGAAGLVPDVVVGARFERDAERSKALGPTLSTPLPIFDRGQGSRARAIAELNGSRARYVALAQEVRSQARRSRRAVTLARDRVFTLRDVVLPLRQKVLDQTQREYNGMLIGIYQLLQAKQEEMAAAREYVAALRDYWTARAAFDAAIGGDPDATTDAAFETQSMQRVNPGESR